LNPNVDSIVSPQKGSPGRSEHGVWRESCVNVAFETEQL
jgi:hypothetical protein